MIQTRTASLRKIRKNNKLFSVMLLELRVRNFRSIRDEQVLSLEASADRDLRHVVRHPAGMPKDSRGVLPVAVIFGANAAGKSVLLGALDALADLALNSFQQAGDPEARIRDVMPFALGEVGAKEPTLLEATFLMDGTRYCFGLEVLKRQVVSEWLFAWPHGTKRVVYLRGNAVVEQGHAPAVTTQAGAFHFGSSLLEDVPTAASLAPFVRPDVLFASILGQTPGSTSAYRWFETALEIDDFDREPDLDETTERVAQDGAFREWLIAFLRWADTGIENVMVRRRMPPPPTAGDAFEEEAEPEYVVRVYRNTSGGMKVGFHLDLESSGTQRVFGLASVLYDVLLNGHLLVIDELATGLHHWIVRSLVEMFQSPESNPNSAQLIFTSHDPLLFDNTLVRRDQLVLIEKDASGATETFSLSDVKEDKPRIGQLLFKDYLSGRYGGAPRFHGKAPAVVVKGESGDAS